MSQMLAEIIAQNFKPYGIKFFWRLSTRQFRFVFVIEINAALYME